MNGFTPENFNEAIQKVLKEHQVERLVTPENSEYYYLKSVKFEDVVLSEESCLRYGAKVTYTVEAKYHSRLPNVGDKSSTYSSWVCVVKFENSAGVDKIPKKISSQYQPQLSEGCLLSESADEKIIHGAISKIKAKVRRAGDKIESEDIFEVNFVNRDQDEMRLREYLIWAPIILKSTRKKIGDAVATQNGVWYFFTPDKSKEGLDKTLKPLQPAKPVQTAAPVSAPSATATQPKKSTPKPKKVKSKEEKRKAMKNAFLQIATALVLAAIIFIVEFATLFSIGSIFTFGEKTIFGDGYILKQGPGLYKIDNENYKEFIALTSYSSNDSRSKVIEGQKRKYVPYTNTSDLNDFNLFQVVPRSAAFSFFDLSERKALETVEDVYKTSWIFDITAPKYIVTDLYIKLEVRYAYNGEEHTVFVDHYVDEYTDYFYSASVKIDFPQEYAEPYTINSPLNNRGDYQGTTLYKPKLDYWSVKVLDVHGNVEVKEVTKK